METRRRDLTSVIKATPTRRFTTDFIVENSAISLFSKKGQGRGSRTVDTAPEFSIRSGGAAGSMRIHQVRGRLLGRMIEMFQSVTSALDGRVVINHEPIFISSLESRQLRPEWRLQSTLRPRRNGCGCFVGAARHRERDLSSLWNINEKKSGRPLIRPASAWPSAGWMNPRPTRTLLSRGNSVRLLKEKQNNLILCHHL